MTDIVASVILGVVQGVTEFLPVSSSGHLIIASALLDLTDERTKIFEIVIQFGSILAVVALYWPRFRGLLFPRPGVRFSGPRGLCLLFLTSLPASLLGLAAHKTIKAYLFNPVSVALALAVGALFILLVERRADRVRPVLIGTDDISPRTALGIGCFQCLSLWPGFSRSTSTIMGGMLLGASRQAAAEYSFLAAVPIMAAATAHSLFSAANLLSVADLPFFACGTLVSFLSALLAIKVLIRLISRISFRPFAWYRLLVAPLVLWLWL